MLSLSFSSSTVSGFSILWSQCLGFQKKCLFSVVSIDIFRKFFRNWQSFQFLEVWPKALGPIVPVDLHETPRWDFRGRVFVASADSRSFSDRNCRSKFESPMRSLRFWSNKLNLAYTGYTKICLETHFWVSFSWDSHRFGFLFDLACISISEHHTVIFLWLTDPFFRKKKCCLEVVSCCYWRGKMHEFLGRKPLPYPASVGANKLPQWLWFEGQDRQQREMGCGTESLGGEVFRREEIWKNLIALSKMFVRKWILQTKLGLKDYLDWLLAHKQNYVEWMLLADRQDEKAAVLHFWVSVSGAWLCKHS